MLSTRYLPFLNKAKCCYLEFPLVLMSRVLSCGCCRGCGIIVSRVCSRHDGVHNGGGDTGDSTTPRFIRPSTTTRRSSFSCTLILNYLSVSSVSPSRTMCAASLFHHPEQTRAGCEPPGSPVPGVAQQRRRHSGRSGWGWQWWGVPGPKHAKCYAGSGHGQCGEKSEDLGGHQWRATKCRLIPMPSRWRWEQTKKSLSKGWIASLPLFAGLF